MEFLAARYVDPLFKRPHLKEHRQHYVRLFLMLGLALFDLYIAFEPAVVFWAAVAVAVIIALRDLPLFHRPRTLTLAIGIVRVAPAMVIWREWELVVRTGFYYVYWLTIAGLLWLQAQRIPKRHAKELRLLAWVQAVAMTAGLYYMAAIAFAYGVYPHIPAARGGGDFAYAQTVDLYFTEQSLASIPASIFDHGLRPAGELPEAFFRNRSIPLKIIDQSASVLFVANPENAGASVDRWSFWELPPVFALRRDSIAMIHSHPMHE